MKKVVSIIMVIALIFCMGVTAMASDASTSGPDNNGAYTTSGTIDNNANLYVTILVYEDTVDGITVDSIQYIDQTQANGSGAYSFTFIPKEEQISGSSDYLVKVGATNLSSPIDAGVIEAPDVQNPTGYTLSGKVNLVGTKTLGSITVTPQTGSPVTVNLNENGEFTFTDLPAGTYTLTAQKKSHLPLTQSVNIVDSNVANINILLTPGDVVDDTDKIINLMDISQLLGGFGYSSGLQGYSANSDIDDSLAIDLTDLAYVVSNFGKVATVGQ